MSESTSSYSSAEGSPIRETQVDGMIMSMPVPVPEINVIVNGDNKSAVSVTRKLSSPTKRSASDGAMKALEGSLNVPNDKLNERHRSRSDCDELVAYTKAKMTEKFDQLEHECGLQLKNKSRALAGVNKNGCDSETGDDIIGRKTSRTISMSEVKEQAYLKLHTELQRAQEILKLRDEEVAKLSRIRDEVESELDDLTASLFQEANNMVYDANILRSKAEKELYEANLKIDVLLAEVQALKMLVLTSTPSKPNPHLHPQIDSSSSGRNTVKSFLSRTNTIGITRKSPSNYELGGTPPPTTNGTPNGSVHDGTKQSISDTSYDDESVHNDTGEFDPIYHDEFVEWKKNPTLDPINSPFIRRIYDEEIYPVFNFKNKDLTSDVLRAIEDNSIIIEHVGDKSTFPKRCALLDSPRCCKYHMKIGDEWFYISQLCRNRITAVCDFFCYLMYIQRGLVKSSFREVYWEIMRRRRNIALSRLGFSCS